ncbi:hypothetical protein IC235_03070 [Hymenobacter sp. BT664]|uniref:Uncharacterized protein n=1 Tax=Hymenobacter montanus TaxID=2771359 RepID=A0A927GHZ9_9BACT|nr:hypothetical protein [Hymenobacter montanus]MBD2766872.1 hypothetical protein [Hymenobacter montanus]
MNRILLPAAPGFWGNWLRTAAVGVACLAGGSPALAQRSARAATHTDSVRAARDGKPKYFPAQFTFASGKQVRGYVEDYSTCLVNQVECYEVPPDQLPPPKIKAISIERLQSMSVDGHTLEALYMRDKPLKILAENLGGPGPMQIFGYAKTKNDMLLPIPLAVPVWVSTGTHEKYYWYVRLAGGELQEIPRAQKDFIKFMSKLCQQAPTLVAELQRSPNKAAGERHPRYQVENAPELVRQYNTLVAQP